MSEQTQTVLPAPQAGDAPMAFVTFLIFAVAGPPLGLLALLLGGWLLSGSLRFPVMPDWHMLRAFGVFSLLAYLLGGFQAVFVGVVAALAQYRHNGQRISALPVLLAGAAAGAVCVGLIAWPSRRLDLPNAAAWIGIHLGAALVCWLIASGLLRLFRSRATSVAA